jgi:murein DD-endopeptidase MepM/ murein hydrolase activator NlpD
LGGEILIGKRPRRSSGWAAGIVVAVALAGGLFLWRRHARTATPTPPPTPPPVAAAAPTPPPAPPKPPSADDVLEKAGLKRLSATIDGPLETAVVSSVGRELGPPLTQMIVRALVWWVEVPADLRKGDTVDVLYQGGEEPSLLAVRFHSGKAGKTFRAYRYKPEGAQFARWYQPDGAELELRLKDAPIDEYDQVTSLLRDGRGHKGVDFKTPVGTPVKATFDGTIERRTWSFKNNGNSLEVRESDAPHRSALYLHLSELPKEAVIGAKVEKGHVIAASGNTGHSFAPHLHYQLMSSSGLVLDPFAAQPTERRTLPATEQTAFTAEVQRLDGMLDLS